jgi:hypothetical protein
MAREPMIYRRIGAALELARWREQEVRAIYLDEADRLELDLVASKKNGCPSHQLSFDDVAICVREFDGQPVKAGSKSRVYGSKGTHVPIPKRLSHRV